MAVQIRYFLESRCKFEYWQLIKTNTNIASESLLSSFCICIWLFLNSTYFKHLYQDTTIYLQKVRCDCLLVSTFFFFYKKCFTFSKMQTLKTVKSIHSIVTRLLRYSHKNILFNEVWLSKSLFLVFFYKKCFTFSKMQTLKTVKRMALNKVSTNIVIHKTILISNERKGNKIVVNYS